MMHAAGLASSHARSQRPPTLQHVLSTSFCGPLHMPFNYSVLLEHTGNALHHSKDLLHSRFFA